MSEPQAHDFRYTDGSASSAGSLSDELDSYDQPDGYADQPLPAVNIAAFCELPETARMIHKAGEDRRAQRAHFEVVDGGLSAAIERYHDEDTPDLIIIETGMRGRELFSQLDHLAAVCSHTTNLIIIGAANDIGLYRELIRAGVSEYLVPPLQSVNLLRAISTLYTDPDEPFMGKSIAFVSAKGGVGSSTVAHNTAWCVAEVAQIDTSIVDLDLAFGTASLNFNQDNPQGVAEALSQPDRVDQVLLDRLVTRCTDRLSLFAAPASVDREWEVGQDAYDKVIDAVRRTVPVVVLDLPNVWTNWTKKLLFSADEVVITATPDLATLRNTKQMYDVLKAARPNDTPPRVVLNQVGAPKRPDIPVKDFTAALDAKPDLVIPYDAQMFGDAANNGQMISEAKADSKTAASFIEFAQLLSGKEARPRPTSLLARLLNRG